MDPNSTPLSMNVLPMRGAAKKASAVFKEQQMSSPESPFGGSSQAKSKVTKTYTTKGNRPRAFLPDRVTTPTTTRATPKTPTSLRPPPRSSGRKRPLAHDSDYDSDPLTPLSSPTPSPAKSRRLSFGIGTGTPVTPTALRRNQSSPVLISSTSMTSSRKSVPDKWDLASLDSFVWVFVNQRGELADKEPEGFDDSGDRMWWPGKV
jgi:hypothetical protein